MDWFDALAQDGVTKVQATLETMKPEFVLGADIVSSLLRLIARALLKRHPRAAVSSRHDRSISCYPQYCATGIEISSGWNGISCTDSSQCRPTELVSPGAVQVKTLRYACWFTS